MLVSAVSTALLALAATSCSGSGDAPPALAEAPLPWAGATPDAALQGTVRDPNGAPIAGAQVCAWDLAEERRSSDARAPACALAGADGGYRLAGLVSATFAVHASAPGFQPARFPRPVPLRPGARGAGIDLVLGAGGVALQGVTVDAHGRPIEGVVVTNYTATRGFDAAGAGAAARSDAEGRFTLWVQPGTHALVTHAARFASLSALFSSADRPRLVLPPESVLAGTVLDAHTRAPVAGARVLVVHNGGKPPVGAAYTDAAGAFQVRRLPCRSRSRRDPPRDPALRRDPRDDRRRAR